MSQVLIDYYKAIVESQGIERAREQFNADVAEIQDSVAKARQFANRKDWTQFQKDRYVLGVANGAEVKLSELRPVGKAYLSISI